MSCEYCYNTGRILVEIGSSQSYACPDCTRLADDESDQESSDESNDELKQESN
jgi:ribosome-binding protein aMBF1 (putative translation factor)